MAETVPARIPSIETPPPELGADTDGVLAEHGYDAGQIAAFRRKK